MECVIGFGFFLPRFRYPLSICVSGFPELVKKYIGQFFFTYIMCGGWAIGRGKTFMNVSRVLKGTFCQLNDYIWIYACHFSCMWIFLTCSSVSASPFFVVWIHRWCLHKQRCESLTVCLCQSTGVHTVHAAETRWEDVHTAVSSVHW